MDGSAPPAGPVQWGGAYAPQSGVDYYGDGSGLDAPFYPPQPMPWERDGRSPIRQFLKEVIPNTYFRLEYLSWDIDDIGSGVIGAPTTQLTTNPSNPIPFGLFDIDTFTGRNLLFPTTEPISFEKTSGLRATWGIPLTFGAVEISGFALQEADAGVLNAIPGFNVLSNFTVPTGTIIIVPPTIPAVTFPVGTTITTITPVPMLTIRVFSPLATPGTPVTQPTNPGDLIAQGSVFSSVTSNAVVIPLLQNGAPSSTSLIYDVGYSASYDSEIWGTEAKMILDFGPDSNGVTLKPLIGFRYMSFDERFKQVGATSFVSNLLQTGPTVYTSSDSLFLPPGQPSLAFGPQRTSIINSEVENSLFGLELGTRAEYNSKWITLGVEPRVSLGLNSYEAQVTTTNLRSALDGVRTTKDEDVVFAPIFDVAMYGKVHLTPHFSLHAGYNFTYLFQVSRPVPNIVYNDNGPGTAPGVVVDGQTQDAHLQGLTVGGELRFRDLKFR
jgi:hypothetical protein